METGATRSAEHARASIADGSVLVGLLGRGIQLSRTPAMHEAEGTAQGLRYVYRLFDTDTLASDLTVDGILRAAEICGFAGLNVTYPYKVAVIDHLDELSPAAAAVGAVNTVVFRNGRRKGHNTDHWGFAESFRRDMAGAALGDVLLIGAGGAGAAVANALLDCGVRQLQVLDVDEDKATRLADKLNARLGNERARACSNSAEVDRSRLDGIVNATPIGMAGMSGIPVPVDFLHPGLWVADIVYFPLETALLREARKVGCRVLPGSGMAVFQAVRAFEHFTGISPDETRMEATFNAFDRPASP